MTYLRKLFISWQNYYGRISPYLKKFMAQPDLWALKVRYKEFPYPCIKVRWDIIKRKE